MPITYNVTIATIDPFANMLFSDGYSYGIIIQYDHFGIRMKINVGPGDSAKNLQKIDSMNQRTD
jgi:hypothetical protein